MSSKKPFFHRKSRAITICFMVTLLLLALSTPLTFTSALSVPGQIDGRVFRDDNVNGADDNEGGIDGVTVTAYYAAGNVAATTTTAIGGGYALTGLTNGETYRIEFSNLPGNYRTGTTGISGTSVRFVQPDTTGVDYAVRVPVGCNQVDPNALVNTYGMVVTCGVDDTTDPVMGYENAPDLSYSASTQVPSMFMHPNWTLEDLGNIYFTEYDDVGAVYAPDSRFTQTNWREGRGLPGVGTGGSGAIYKLDSITGAPTVWATLPQEGNTDPLDDSGLGGITYDYATDSMYVVNMSDGTIYQLDANGNTVSTYQPNPATLGVANEVLTYFDFDTLGFETVNYSFQAVPFGLDIYKGRLYYTVHDATGNGSLVVRSVALDASGNMIPSTDVEEINFVMTNPTDPNLTTDGFWEGYPIVADIDFSPTGEMAVGSFSTGVTLELIAVYYVDGDQSSMFNHAGAVYVFDEAGGTWTQTAVTSVGQEPYVSTIGTLAASPNSTSTGGVAWNLDPDNPEILWMSGGDLAGEDSQWGVVGYDSTQLDNVFSQEDATNYIQFLFQPQVPDPGSDLDPKGNGGDVDVFWCLPDSLEIGNYVWFDTDNDGIQDPDEAPIVGATVELLDAGGNVIGAATTDAAGYYVFSNGSAPANPSSGGVYDVVGLTENTTGYQLRVSENDAAVDATADHSVTSTDTDGSTNGDFRDNDATSSGGFAVISFDTGSSGENDHAYDFGFVQALGAISGNVSADTDGNMVPDTNLSGIVLNLLDSSGNPVLDGNGNAITTTTDANGDYLFDSVPAGEYQVQEVQPVGYNDQSEVDGGDDGDNADNGIVNNIPVTVDPGETDSGNDFVEQLEVTAVSLSQQSVTSTTTILLLLLLCVIGLVMVTRHKLNKS